MLSRYGQKRWGASGLRRDADHLVVLVLGQNLVKPCFVVIVHVKVIIAIAVAVVCLGLGLDLLCARTPSRLRLALPLHPSTRARTSNIPWC
jgi:hypothetical protein